MVSSHRDSVAFSPLVLPNRLSSGLPRKVIVAVSPLVLRRGSVCSLQGHFPVLVRCHKWMAIVETDVSGLLGNTVSFDQSVDFPRCIPFIIETRLYVLCECSIHYGSSNLAESTLSMVFCWRTPWPQIVQIHPGSDTSRTPSTFSRYRHTFIVRLISIADDNLELILPFACGQSFRCQSAQIPLRSRPTHGR